MYAINPSLQEKQKKTTESDSEKQRAAQEANEHFNIWLDRKAAEEAARRREDGLRKELSSENALVGIIVSASFFFFFFFAMHREF